MFFKRFITIFFVASLFATKSFPMKRLWTGFHSLKTKISNFNPQTVATEDFFGNMDVESYKEPEPLKPEYRKIITFYPIRHFPPEGGIETEWVEKKETIEVWPGQEPIEVTQQRPSRFSKRQHNNLREQYLQEYLFEMQRYKKMKTNPWNFEKKVRAKITEEVHNTSVNELEQNGTTIANAQPKDIDKLNQKLKQRKDVQPYIKSFNQEFKENDLYTKMMECLQQKDQTQCKAENKKFVDGIAADFFKQYYGYDTEQSSSANQIKMAKNYLLKRIPVEIGLAAMCASDPDNLRELEKELQYEL